MRSSLPKIALVGLKVTSVTPIVNVSGGGGAGTSTVGVTASVAPCGFGGAGAAFGGGEATTITVYLFNSSNGFKNATRSADAFFSTIAHLIPFNSSNSWFLLIAIFNLPF